MAISNASSTLVAYVSRSKACNPSIKPHHHRHRKCVRQHRPSLTCISTAGKLRSFWYHQSSAQVFPETEGMPNKYKCSVPTTNTSEHPGEKNKERRKGSMLEQHSSRPFSPGFFQKDREGVRRLLVVLNRRPTSNKNNLRFAHLQSTIDGCDFFPDEKHLKEKLELTVPYLFQP